MPNYKCIYLIKRNPSLSVEEFPRRWRHHAKLTATTQLNKYFTGVVQCSLARGEDFPADATQEYDGASLLDMRNRAATADIWLEPEQGAILAPDELLTFSRLIRECMINTQERVSREGPFTSVLLLRFIRRAPGLTESEFHAGWEESYVPLELEGESGGLVQRAVQNIVIDQPPPDFRFDLITELYFDDIETARRYHEDHALQDRLAAERARLSDPSANIAFLAKVTHAYRPGVVSRA